MPAQFEIDRNDHPTTIIIYVNWYLGWECIYCLLLIWPIEPKRFFLRADLCWYVCLDLSRDLQNK